MVKAEVPRVKVALLGSVGTGKTCLIQRLVHGRFNDPGPSIAVCQEVHTMRVENEDVRLTIVDTIGQEKYYAVCKTCYRDAQVVLIVYSVCDRQSYRDVQRWVKAVEEECVERPICVLVANKTDSDSPEVSRHEGQSLATEHRCDFVETSAATGEGVEEAFRRAVAARLRKAGAGEAPAPVAPASDPGRRCC